MKIGLVAVALLVKTLEEWGEYVSEAYGVMEFGYGKNKDTKYENVKKLAEYLTGKVRDAREKARKNNLTIIGPRRKP